MHPYGWIQVSTGDVVRTTNWRHLTVTDHIIIHYFLAAWIGPKFTPETEMNKRVCQDA